MNKEELKDTLWSGFASWEIGGGSEIEMIHVPKKWLFEHIDQLDEPEKPVVPAFVAEWIEEAKRNENWGIVGLINSFRNGIIQAPCKTRKYFDENPRNVILAYLDGYTVEENKYQVKDKNDCFLLTKNSEGEIINAYSKVVYKNKGQLTEQEIKDYDERFWIFAVPVEEEEE